MLTKRVIPCMDVKDGRVVKGVNFVNLRDAGDPIELAQRYDEQRADEVIFLDITATHEVVQLRWTWRAVQAKNCICLTAWAAGSAVWKTFVP